MLKLNENWITGFTQADGCFNISFTKKKNNKLGVRARFILTQHKNQELLIKSIQNFFKCGIIIKSNKDIQFVVNSIDQLINIIIPHFDKYPLKDGKFISYLKLKKIVLFMKNKQHLNKEKLIEIINLAYDINLLGKRKINKDELFKHLSIENNFYLNFPIQNEIKHKNLDLSFISGLIQGDGCFNISFRKDLKIQAQFIIVQDIYSKNLLLDIRDFFKCGNIRDKKVKMYALEIKNIKDLYEKILPLFKETLFYLDKKKQFYIFKQIVNLMYNKLHFKENKLKILELAYEMNNNGIKRKLTKQQYIEIIKKKYN